MLLILKGWLKAAGLALENCQPPSEFGDGFQYPLAHRDVRKLPLRERRPLAG